MTGRRIVELTDGRASDRVRCTLTSAELAKRLGEFSDATGVNLLNETGLAWIEYLSDPQAERPTAELKAVPW